MVIALSFLVLIWRVYTLQFTQRDIYVARADDNRFDIVSIPATRGIILDRYGKELAKNVPSANVVVTPAFLPDDSDAEMAVLRRLSGMIGVPLSGVLNTVDERGIPQRSLLTMIREGQGIAPYRPVTVKTDIDQDVARIIMSERNSLPGVDIDWVSVREYPTGALTAHLIGYMGPIPPERADEYEALGYVLDRDRIGYDGIEFSLDPYLAGNPGFQVVERDVAGLIIRTIGQTRPPQPGYSIRTTIDVDLQREAQKALVNMIDFQNTYWGRTITERGVVIAMNPKTGEILAMVSWPTYDNSRFARAIDYPYYLQVSQDPLRPLFNQAISSLYPPGSIFKVITATAVLEEEVVTPDQILTDPGQIQLENRYYPNDPARVQNFVCWKDDGHQEVSFVQAIAWSCDVYFYKVGGGYPGEVPGIGLGINRLSAWMDLFGLGQFTGVELAGEIDGTIPTPEWKRRTWGENWSTGDTYNSAFGQGYVLTTPLQMLHVLNTIANNGIITRPTLVREIIDADGKVVKGFEPDTSDLRGKLRAYWPDAHDGEPYPGTLDQTLRYVQEGMRGAVTMEGGTANDAALPYVAVAGKTGTAEYCDDVAASLNLCEPGNWPAHAWFMAYAPYHDPEISVIAFVYNGNEGSIVALPVAREVMDAYFRLKTERAIEQQANDLPTPTP